MALSGFRSNNSTRILSCNVCVHKRVNVCFFFFGKQDTSSLENVASRRTRKDTLFQKCAVCISTCTALTQVRYSFTYIASHLVQRVTISTFSTQRPEKAKIITLSQYHTVLLVHNYTHNIVYVQRRLVTIFTECAFNYRAPYAMYCFC